MAFPNGSCLTAEPITIPSVTTLDVTGGEVDPSLPAPPCAYDPDRLYEAAWYTFTLSAPARLRIQTCASTTADTLLALWGGTCGALVPIACSEDDCGAGGIHSTLLVDLPAGTYYISITDYYPSDTGNYVLDISEEGTPVAGTSCDTATVIGPALPITTAPIDVSGFGDVDPAPCPSCAYDCNDRHSRAWFSWTPAADVYVTIDTLLSDYDTLLSVWIGDCAGPTPLTEIACSEDEGGVQSSLNFQAIGGVTYLIQVSSFLDPGGSLVLHIEESTPPPPPPPPSNDAFADAIDLTALVGPDGLSFKRYRTNDDFDLRGATLQEGEPTSCRANADGVTITGSAWWKITPTIRGRMTFGANQYSGARPYYSVYTGTWGALVEVGSDKIVGVDWTVDAGTTYYIRVATADPGTILLDLHCQYNTETITGRPAVGTAFRGTLGALTRVNDTGFPGPIISFAGVFVHTLIPGPPPGGINPGGSLLIGYAHHPSGYSGAPTNTLIYPPSDPGLPEYTWRYPYPPSSGAFTDFEEDDALLYAFGTVSSGLSDWHLVELQVQMATRLSGTNNFAADGWFEVRVDGVVLVRREGLRLLGADPTASVVGAVTYPRIVGYGIDVVYFTPELTYATTISGGTIGPEPAACRADDFSGYSPGNLTSCLIGSFDGTAKWVGCQSVIAVDTPGLDFGGFPAPVIDATGGVDGTPILDKDPAGSGFSLIVLDFTPLTNPDDPCASDDTGPLLDLICPPDHIGYLGVAYSSGFTVDGGTGPYTYALILGSLPPGLSLAADTGIISGTPTMPGNYVFQVQVTDALAATLTRQCAIVVPRSQTCGVQPADAPESYGSRVPFAVPPVDPAGGGGVIH